MKRTITFLILACIGSLAFAQNDVKAKQLLDEVSKKMNTYSNIYATFAYKLDNNKENVHQETKGDVTMKGDLYNVNFMGTRQIYDGKKVYTIIDEDEEVNISNIDPNSDDAVTPSRFFSFYKNGFTYKWDILQNVSGRKVQYIKLIPIDSKSEINNILLGIDIGTNHIYRLIETGNNGTTTTLTINDFKTDQALPNSLFAFDENRYKSQGYIINNL